MSEYVIEQAVEAIDDGNIIEALEIVNEGVEEEKAEQTKEAVVKQALAEHAFGDVTIGIFIRNHSKRRKIARSLDPEINRMLIRAHYKRP